MSDSRVFSIAIAIAIVLLVVLVAVIVVTVRRREMRKVLGLPANSTLGQRDRRMFQAFEDTDVRLSKTLPYLPKGERQALARKIAREKGLVLKKTQKDR